MIDVKSRIIQFVEYKNISRRQFLLICGFSESYFNNISKGLSYEAIDKIKEAYPELSMPWLVLGEGSMLKHEASTPQSISSNPALIEELKEEISALKAENNQLKGENKILREIAGLKERKELGEQSA